MLTDRTSTVEPKVVRDITDVKVTPTVGSCVRIGDTLSTSRIGELLNEGDNWSVSGYPGCDFRYPVNNGGPITSVAVNVTITGRKVLRYYGDSWVRVKIEFVGDCEPSTYAGGFMLLNEKNMEYVI